MLTDFEARVFEASLWKLWRREKVGDDVRNDGERRLRVSAGTSLAPPVSARQLETPLYTDEVDTCA